jgi:hypothetical protein
VPGVGPEQAKWSPDGTQLLATQIDFATQDYRLVLIDVASGQVTDLTDDGVSGFGDWLDDKTIVYERDVVGPDGTVSGSQLQIPKLKDGALKRDHALTDLTGFSTYADAQSDGPGVLFLRRTSDSSSVELWVADNRGKAPACSRPHRPLVLRRGSRRSPPRARGRAPRRHRVAGHVPARRRRVASTALTAPARWPQPLGG